jgi:hypothetical protein
MGWDTNSTPSTVVYTDKQVVSNLGTEPDQVVNLYAFWKRQVDWPEIKPGVYDGT